jgi:hypothetical protein
MVHVARLGPERNVFKIIVEKPEGKRQLRIPRRRWEKRVIADLREIGWGGGADWVFRTRDKHRWRGLVNTAIINLCVPPPWNWLYSRTFFLSV